jgi:hypothetical protein
VITLRNASVDVEIDPEQGAAIRYLGLVGGQNVLAHRTWELPAPTWRTGTYGNSSADLHANYDLSWREQFPNAGAACEYRGTPLPFHGDAWSSEWQVVEHSPDAVVLEFTGRLPLRLRRSMRLVGHSLLIEEVVTNLCPVPLDIIWGHHPVVPATPGVRLDLPGGRVRTEPTPDGSFPDLVPGTTSRWPVGVGVDGEVDLSVIPVGPVSRMVIVDELVAGWAAARDPERGLGLALAWDAQAFPALWLWLEIGGQGFPWFGRARVLGVEPQRSSDIHGLVSAIDHGLALRVEPDAQVTSWITATVLTDAASEVVGVERDGSVRVH